MKAFKFLSVLLLLFATVLISSCENEPVDSALLDSINNGGGVDGGGSGGGTGGSGTDGGTSGSSFTAKIGSFNFVAQNIEAVISDSAFGAELNITGFMSNGRVISIQMIKPALGTFAANTGLEKLLLFQYFEDLIGINFFSSFDISSNKSIGSFTITKYDIAAKKISGTFSFSGFDYQSSPNKRQITNGVINNVSFTIEP
jgi:hypothetical protein